MAHTPKSSIPSTGALAILSGTFLSGTMMSLSLLAVPVLLSTTTSPPQLLREWAHMYSLGHQVLPSISVATMGLHFYTAISQRQKAKQPRWKAFVIAGLTTVLMLPFTWFVMTPTNAKLFALEEGAKTGTVAASWEEVRGLVAWWRLLHIARSCFPLIGSLVGLSGLWE